MTAPIFVDVSSFQGNIDFATYAAFARKIDGKARLAMKATEGIGFVDPSFSANRAGALNAGIEEIYIYHFGRPDLGNDPMSEAKFMHSVVGDIRNGDAIFLDYEVSSTLATSAWAYAWLSQAQDSYDGKVPGVYASSAYIAQHLQDARLAQFSLWLANWQFTPDERPPVPAPWTSYEFVQYSDRASIPGIPGNVDADIFLGKETPTPMSIDLNTPGVSSFFTGDANQWTCIQTGFTLHGEILAFYQQVGGSGLCGITDLGLPKSNELPITGHPGIVNQEFERGAVRFDPTHALDNPPGSGRVYKIHTDQDPRTIALQAQIATLEQQPTVATLQQINTLASQIVKLSTVQ